ncbi:MAG: DNA-protecting protein DprA [Geothrix sp.]|uniref:DNA-processing protein DprA n=1 Tax=Geothrix sp. TaxID=1962974 RepID=UPI001813FACD|nr:DNA-processing protein DprA [Geothrix sp.]NWJ41995.1 DNA-protecting protein DprA [Geothrix sp.]WIL20033.1 MAG: DNA-protecting protein DprA [Geothrix sp.]
MDLRLWALAFTVLDWTERQKAEVWAALQAGVAPALPPGQARTLAALAADLPRHRQEASDRGARLLLPGDEGVDALLAPLPYPVALWVRGSLPPPGPRIALVGSRQAGPGGRARARAWARALTEAGVAVISGLARGIDGAAHAGALEAGATWGVMGSGLDHPYPPEHRPLMDRMVAAGGGVITPFPPAALPLKWHFPRRNWLLAAWVDAVLVMEAARRSGSLVTAKLALDLGKELFVVPGSEGTDALLEEGAAHLCIDVGDLLALG